MALNFDRFDAIVNDGSDPDGVGATLTMFHPLPAGGEQPCASVYLFRSPDDGAVVVQVDTEANTGRLRVNVNDGEVFDRDPETDDRAALIGQTLAETVPDGALTDDQLDAVRDALVKLSHAGRL